jgi:hypothetical protein
MKAEESAKNFTILNHTYVFDTQVDGIALSPLDKNFETLYFCPLTSNNIYSVPVKPLKAEHTVANGEILLDGSAVTLVGTKTSQSDGLAMDSKGLLFYGLLQKNSVNYWNSSSGTKLNSADGELVVVNDIDLQWPDTFAFDDHGYLYVTTNRLQRFSTNTLDPKESNFRVARMFIGTKSYMHSASEPVVTVTTGDQPGPGISTSSSSTENYSIPAALEPQDGHGHDGSDGHVHYHPGSEYEHVNDNSNSMPSSTPSSPTSTTYSPPGQQSRSTTAKAPRTAAAKNSGNSLTTSIGAALVMISICFL